MGMEKWLLDVATETASENDGAVAMEVALFY